MDAMKEDKDKIEETLQRRERIKERKERQS